MSEKAEGDLGAAGRIYVGIDQSYTGFAVTLLGDNDAYYSLCRPLKGTGDDERLDDAKALVEISLWQTENRLAEVVMEGYAYGASQNAHMAGELGAIVRRAVRRAYQRPLIASPSQVKKYATGRGNAKKNEILLAVYKNWGVEFTNDNMADAYVLARIGTGEGRNIQQRAVVDLVTATRGGT